MRMILHLIFGMCMGRILGISIISGEYPTAILSVIAFVLGLYLSYDGD